MLDLFYDEFYVDAAQKSSNRYEEKSVQIVWRSRSSQQKCLATSLNRIVKVTRSVCISGKSLRIKPGKKILFCLNLTYALSFYRSQNDLCRSKNFVSDQKIFYILCQSQTFCARQKDDLHSVKLVFVSVKKFLKRH